jgi:hypothetical protein
MLSISLLNVRSLTRHYPDIQAHQDLGLVDVNCFTETWMKKQKSIQVLGKTVFCQDRPKKQSGRVTMYVSDSFKPQLILTYSDRYMEFVTVKEGSLSIMLVCFSKCFEVTSSSCIARKTSKSWKTSYCSRRLQQNPTCIVRYPHPCYQCLYNKYWINSISSLCVRRYTPMFSPVNSILLRPSNYLDWSQFSVTRKFLNHP